MTFQIASFLSTICAAFTGLITEAIKKMFKVTKPTIVAAIVSVVVGVAVPVGYIILNQMAFTAQDVVYLIAMVVLTWLCSTIGYDKVKEVLKQLIVTK